MNKLESRFETGLFILVGLTIVIANLLFENNNSLLSNGIIALYYLVIGVLFIVLAVLLIRQRTSSKFFRNIGILACLTMLVKMLYQATLFL